MLVTVGPPCSRAGLGVHDATTVSCGGPLTRRGRCAGYGHGVPCRASGSEKVDGVCRLHDLLRGAWNVRTLLREGVQVSGRAAGPGMRPIQCQLPTPLVCLLKASIDGLAYRLHARRRTRYTSPSPERHSLLYLRSASRLASDSRWLITLPNMSITCLSSLKIPF